MAGKRPTLLGTLVAVDPEKARRAILAAHDRCGGNTVRAAKLLGISHRTLCRWNAELGLGPMLERLRGRVSAVPSAPA